ncbi:LytTR family transcriptional regulator [Flagellimonas sp. HMM57]|uniref:LytR/AlgR family response regulator transcription factor n=1 Tax=unclassified Flagellimonas TaxID=2644544 RepID=UPI0013D8C69B|nr:MULTISPECIES: LytTR family DNA-binding domain-containing protein [unclassified Flagellimonas]UII77325.1 LytTR family transcriptional regulator [Flagellimonas sp. HMM57]
MAMPRFDFKKAKRYLPHIAFIGVGIGTANYFMNPNLNWIQWIVQSISNSFIIGYILVLIASNKSWFRAYFKSDWQLYSILFLAFFITGVIASEVERIIGPLLFNNEEYRPFSGGKIYVFNGVISIVLGFSFFINHRLFPYAEALREKNLDTSSNEADLSSDSSEIINQVPVKLGDNILLIPIEEIAYMEAYDNYSFLHDLKGEKKLCDYSLLFLEKRLGDSFLRVHRKYIVNVGQIKQFKPHMNGRYVIHFNAPQLNPIISSKGYSNSIRKLIKLQ